MIFVIFPAIDWQKEGLNNRGDEDWESCRRFGMAVPWSVTRHVGRSICMHCIVL